MEPDYLAQTAEPMTPDERREWFRSRAREAGAQGCVHGRMSVDDAENPTMALVEAWKVRPSDEGEPRWQMVEGQPKDGAA